MAHYTQRGSATSHKHLTPPPASERYDFSDYLEKKSSVYGLGLVSAGRDGDKHIMRE